MFICVDFDGTVVKHEYPRIGEPLEGCIDYLKQFTDNGAYLILFTMRSGVELDEAVAYLQSNGVELYGVNVNPTQHTWTKSPKAYGQLYIDDAAFGCPLISEYGSRPYVDWSVVGPKVLEQLQG